MWISYTKDGQYLINNQKFDENEFLKYVKTHNLAFDLINEREHKHIYNFLCDCIEDLEIYDDIQDGYYYTLGGDVALCIEWEKGFGRTPRSDVIQSEMNPDYAICYSLKHYDSENNVEDWKYCNKLGSCSILPNRDDKYLNAIADNIQKQYCELLKTNDSEEEMG